MASSEQNKRTQAIWRQVLISASRTALACIIVGCVTFYGPASVKEEVAFPAFSYVTVILIITNATLGDTIRGCWFAFIATIQSVCPAILCLSIVGPTKLSAISTSLVLAISGFFIVLPEWTHIVSKRIALGQIVILYVIGYINAEHTEAVMHPVHVAASTALGAFACVLAMLFPYPHLAFSEVKNNSRLFAENASERLKLFVKAFSAEDGASAQASISQAKCLAPKGRKFLQCIKARQESMLWERFPFNFLGPYCKNPADKFQEMETPLRGMEIALTNTSVPTSFFDEEFKEGVNRIEGKISQNLEQLRNHLPCKSTLTVPESNSGHTMDTLQSLETVPSNERDLLSYFFLFCMKLFYSKSRTLTSSPKSPPKTDGENTIQKENQENETGKQQTGLSLEQIWANWPSTLSRGRVIPAMKLSLSLGFAVLFGIYYSKPNGFWAGLPVAISLAASREATFKIANVKAQGTVIGSVYGVIGCFVFEKFVQVRFIALLPWFIFSSFLQQSKMYGQAGGVSAVIGAVLILGRVNFGPTSEFAIERIVETFIGLSCSIMVELMFQPTRASTLAKVQLSKALSTLQVSLSSVHIRSSTKEELLERQKMVRTRVTKLEKFVSEAEVEPNFWFSPFHSASYRKLLVSLTKICDILLFTANSIGSLEEHLERLDVEKIDGHLELVWKMTSSALKCFAEVTAIKSLSRLDKDLMKNNKSQDIELGKSGYSNTSLDEKEVEKVMATFLDHLKEAVEKIEFAEDEGEMKSQVIMSLSALGFCCSSFMRETREIEKGIKELLQWENPTTQINLKEISCKIHTLYE